MLTQRTRFDHCGAVFVNLSPVLSGVDQA